MAKKWWQLRDPEIEYAARRVRRLSKDIEAYPEKAAARARWLTKLFKKVYGPKGKGK
jgi:hypothetical protein